MLLLAGMSVHSGHKVIVGGNVRFISGRRNILVRPNDSVDDAIVARAQYIEGLSRCRETGDIHVPVFTSDGINVLLNSIAWYLSRLARTLQHLYFQLIPGTRVEMLYLYVYLDI